MKKSTLSLALALIPVFIIAQTPKEVSSEIKNVVVYQQGAQISREGNVAIPKGTSTIILKGLPEKITPSSIQISAANDVMIVSVTHNIDYLNKSQADKELAGLRKRHKSLTDSIKVVTGLRSVYSQEKAMILANSSLAGDNGVNITELEQAASFFRKRLTEIETISYSYDNKILDLKNELVSLSKQLLELNSRTDLPTSQIMVVVSSEAEVKTLLKLNYFIPDAGWIPTYDIRISETDKPINFYYKAKVAQNTDEDWNNVKMVLSTGNPSLSNTKPELSTYYLTFDNYYRYAPATMEEERQPYRGVVTGKVTDAESGEPLIGTSILVKGTTNGTIADINGNYSLELPSEKSTLVYAFIGYDSQELPFSSATMNVKLKPSLMALEEVVVIGYGSKRDDAYGSLSGRASGVNIVKKKEMVPVAIEKRQLTTEFQIDIPYSIPSDNQPYDVNMVEYEINALYDYFAVPKISDNAFLIAKIPDWINYNLLSGNSHIFFKGVYQGESFIDLDTPGDTLSISVGRDKDIIIEREIQKDFVNKSLAGQIKREQKAYTISVKNNKPIPIKISIEDQFPVSKIDDIKVDLIEYSGAKRDDSNGKLIWDLIINPNEKRVLDLRYSVRYPSNRTVIVD